MDDTDALLVEKTLNGSMECYDVLMRRHERNVYRAVYGFGKTRENAMDICQNVFLKTYRSLGSFDNRSSFRTWLMRIASNEGLNWVRSQTRKAPQGTVDLEQLTSEDDQEKTLLDKERQQQIMSKMECLSQKHRLAVTLRYFQEMSIRDIAGVLECSEGVVRNILFRSVRRLKAAVDSP